MQSSTILKKPVAAATRSGGSSARTFLTGRERTFDANQIIVSKTDPKGIITYVNQVFTTVAQYTEEELLGAPHSIVRHPGMPRCVFRFMWDTIKAKKELFAYVLNRAKSGDHYWVFAHVTPTFDEQGKVIGYHSNRRLPSREAVARIEPIYALLLAEERRHGNSEDAMRAATAYRPTCSRPASVLSRPRLP